MRELINKAITFTTLVHGNQTRKGTDIPYIFHCLEAGMIALSLTKKNEIGDSDVVCAAILHDTMEDAYVSYETLKEMFNENIANLVKSQSEDKTKPWIDRKKDMIRYLSTNDSKSVEIAILADKLSNMRSISKDYEIHQEMLWDRFNASKESQHWYYHSIAESLSQVKDTREYREYKELIKTTFLKRP